MERNPARLPAGWLLPLSLFQPLLLLPPLLLLLPPLMQAFHSAASPAPFATLPLLPPAPTGSCYLKSGCSSPMAVLNPAAVYELKRGKWGGWD